MNGRGGLQPLARSVLRRRLEEGDELERDSDDTSSSDSASTGWSSEEELDAFDFNEEEWETNAYLPPMARCQYCLLMRNLDKIATPQARNRALEGLVDALNHARRNYTRVVRYGFFHMRMINLVDPRSLLPSNMRFARGRDIHTPNSTKRYRVLAPFTLCETCVEVIEKKTRAYRDQFEPETVKQPEE